MRIAITGANGYIGSALVKFCLDKGCSVTAVDFDNKFIDKRADYKQINIFDDSLDCFKAFDEPDVLIHMAWRNGFRHNDESHIEDLPKHFNFLKSVINAGVKYVSVMGTMHEVGYHEGAIDEFTPCNPMSLYGISKNALRQMMLMYAASENVNFHWLRAFYIIGDDLRSNSVFGKLLAKAKSGEKHFSLNSGKNMYDFIALDELCRQILCASVQGEINGVINVCSGKPVPLGEMIEKYISDNNLDIFVDYGKFPDRPYDSPVIYGDNSKVTDILRNSSFA